jgi:general nucleoside transport system ATP-binding protein
VPRSGRASERLAAKARKVLTDLAREYELDVDPDAMIEDLSVGHQQRVEILKALYRRADILILDEPTGVLTPAEADHLFRILGGLRDQGKTVILITHKLREIMEATDNVSVMRRGTMVATVKTAETSPEQLAELMVGRKVLLRSRQGACQTGGRVLKVENLRVRDEHKVERLKGVSASKSARARFWASPGSPATASPNCWRRWAASPTRRGASP